MSRFRDPDPDEQFYARALGILVGPTRRVATLMRALNILYWSAMMLGLAWIVSQAIDRAVPIGNRSQTLLTPGVPPGAELKVAYALTRWKVCATDVSWTEVDGAGEVHRFGPSHVPVPGKAGADAFTYGWPTPASASPGPSVLRVALEYQCPGNYLQAFYPVTESLPEIRYETLRRPESAPGKGPH